MNFGKYIHNLLLSNKTVIIPGFGAFISEYKPAEITDSEVLPPSQKVSFTTSVRNNDGLLVDFVAKEEKVSHFDALKIIEKERDNIAFLLDKGEEVEIPEVGKLSLIDNEIKFYAVIDEAHLAENFGLETVSLEKLNELEESPEEVSDLNSEEQFQTTNEDAEINEAVENSENDDDNETVNSEGEVVDESQLKEEDEKNVEDEIVEEAEPVVPLNDPDLSSIRVAEQAEPEEKKKRAGWYWFILILIPIIIAGIFVFRNNSGFSSKELNDITVRQIKEENIETEAEPMVVADSLAGDKEEITPIDTVKTQSEETNELVSESSDDKPIFYLVGGSFELEENALTYMEELKEKGFEPFNMGKKGKFYMVGVGKYETEGQAFRARQVMWETSPDAGLWILEE